MARPLIQRQTSLSANIVAFCRFLRSEGFRIGPREEADTLQAVQVLAPFGEAIQLHDALRTVLVRSQAQAKIFTELYNRYWRELEKAVDSKVKDVAEENRQRATQPQAPKLETLKSWLYGNEPQEERELSTYSPGGRPGERDFASFSDAELDEILALIRRLARTLALQHSRRREQGPYGKLDLRRTLRANLRRGGEMLDLVWQQPKPRRQRLLLLCDVSQSMDLYSQFLIHFLYGFQQAYQRIETFIFSNELFRITPQLKETDYHKALERLTQEVAGWSGGTQIGACLDQFIQQYASRYLDRQTIVILLSDGWDTGAPELLANSMRYLQRKAGKTIWLNPLAGQADFSPDTIGMQAALPFVDVFHSAHNLDSLRGLGRLL